VQISSAGPLEVFAAAAPNGAVQVTWKVGGTVPAALERTVEIKIGKGPEDQGWHAAGKARIEANQFTIKNVPFPVGTDLRVLVEATDGSYLALSGTVTLK
jgi:hypothetical protein